MNMYYCIFENTLADLQACFLSLDSDVSETEKEKRAELIALCKRISAETETKK